MGGMGGMVVFWGKGGRGSPIFIYTNSRSSASAAATCMTLGSPQRTPYAVAATEDSALTTGGTMRADEALAPRSL